MAGKNGNLDKLSQDLNRQETEFKNFKNVKLVNKMKVSLEKIVEDSFSQEEFKGGKSGKWAGRKNNANDSKKRTDRGAILIGQGILKDSIRAEETGPGEVTLGTDLVYAQIHNEGLEGKAFGKHSFKMSKRQFMPIEGEPLPTEVQADIDTYIDSEMDKIFK